MREIKFRAFVDDDIIEGWPAIMHRVEQMRWGEDDELEAVHLLPCGWIDVKWIEVLQYTGLKDKNGVEIYEGDILKLHARDCNTTKEWIGVVEFGNPNGEYSWGWQIRPLQEVEINTDILLWVETEMPNVSCEIIGNIYETPEPLESE